MNQKLVFVYLFVDDLSHAVLSFRFRRLSMARKISDSSFCMCSVKVAMCVEKTTTMRACWSVAIVGLGTVIHIVMALMQSLAASGIATVCFIARSGLSLELMRTASG